MNIHKHSFHMMFYNKPHICVNNVINRTLYKSNT